MTTNPNAVTDEQLDIQLQELTKKVEKSEDDLKQIETLKGERQTRVQKRIDQLTWRAKAAEEQLAEKEAEIERIKAEKAGNKDETPVIKKKEVVKIGEQVFYSDATLMEMVKTGELSESEAYLHQQQRIEEAAAEKAYQRIKYENIKQQTERERLADRDAVLKEYPQFSKVLPDGSPNPNFNPADPVYKLATELWQEGLQHNPRGLSLAIKRAKQILRVADNMPDVSEDLSLLRPSASPSEPGPKEVPLSEDEREAALRMYTRGDVTNPATGRPYTEQEAIAKATKAKNIRMTSRRMQ